MFLPRNVLYRVPLVDVNGLSGRCMYTEYKYGITCNNMVVVI